MDNRERILGIIRMHGPVIPIQIAKALSTDTMIASAHLSELVASKELRISHVKHGSSPLYYLPGQETALQNYIQNLHEKERRSCDMLRQQLVMRDSEQEPLVRVTLREIRDFAIPLQVTHEGNTELFWKWYLLSNEEAEKKISMIVGAKEKPEAKVPETILKRIEETMQKKPEAKQEIAKKDEKERIETKPAEKTRIPVEQKKLVEQKKEAVEEESSPFSRSVESFVKEGKIEVIERTVIKRDSDIEMIVRVPSAVGSLLYFCKARNKKKINDGDLSSAFIHSQTRKMPILFVTNGELTKKAKEMLDNEFKSMTMKRI